MQIAVAVGGCDLADADLLRRAMGSKRGVEKIESLRAKLYAGMASNGIVGDDADEIYARIQSFSSFGFAESHALSFALLVYASAWMRLHYPGAFLASLLRAQPMGFYSPQTLVADARRHGVTVLRPDILHSGVDAGLEPVSLLNPGTPHPSPSGDDGCLHADQPPVGEFDSAARFDTNDHRRDGAFAVRLGLAEVTGIGAELALRIVEERENAGDYTSMAELVRRVGLSTAQLEALAAAGAFESLGLSVREASWIAGDAARDKAEYLQGSMIAVQPPLFSMPSEVDVLLSDLWATGVSPSDHPLRHLRPELKRRGVLSSVQLAGAEAGRRVEVGGVVTHRQRPQTASGITFMNLEDETGLVNVVCSVGVWARYRRIARESSALIIRGILERSPEGVTNILADRFEALETGVRTFSRDFQ